MWQELNKRLGVNLKLIISSDVDYKSRFATTIASGDIPDLMSIPLYQNPAGMYGALRALFADLTPYLRRRRQGLSQPGECPELPLEERRQCGRDLRLPVPNTVYLNAKYVNQTLLDKVGMSAGPKTLDDLTQLMKAFTRPQDNLYATAYATGGTLEETFIKEIFRVPNNWRQDAAASSSRTWSLKSAKWSSRIRNRWSTWARFVRVGPAVNRGHGGCFRRGQLGTFTLGFPSYQNIWDQSASINPSIKVRTLLPFGADGGKGVYYTTNGTQPSVVAIKKASPDRIKELLRVLNFLAAPFGTTEQLLLGYGVEGTDFTFDANGTPAVTDRGTAGTQRNVHAAG